MRPRSLRALLFGVFFRVVLVAAVAVSLFIVLWRLPQVQAQNEREQTRIAELTLHTVESRLDEVERTLEALAAIASDDTPLSVVAEILQRMAGSGGAYLALYLVDDDARILALGLSGPQADRRGEWLGDDLSGLDVLQRARATGSPAWSRKYVSPAHAAPVVALAVPGTGGRALMAEVAVDGLTDAAAPAMRSQGLLVMVIDERGEIVAAPDMDAARQRVNVRPLPVVASLLEGRQSHGRFTHDGARYAGTALRSDRLGWLVLVAYPAAVADATRQAAILVTAATLALAAAFGLFTMHRLSRRLGQRLGQSVAYAGAVAEGQFDQPLPPTGVSELETLNADLQRMGRRIQEREAQLRSIIDNTPTMAIQMFDAQGRVVDWNPASQAILGYTRQEALGRTLGDLIYTPSQQQAFLDILGEIRRTGQPFGPFEGEVRRRDGSPCVLLSTTFGITGPDSEPLFACMDIDITAMKRQQAAVQANEQKYSAFFEDNPVALAVLRQEGENFEYLDVNLAWETLLGYPRMQVLNRLLGPALGFTIFDRPEERRRFLAGLAAPGQLAPFDVRLRCAGGHAVTAVMTVAKISVAGEALLVYSLQDVTEKRALERDLRELNAELEQRIAERTASLTQANADLQRTLDDLRRTQDRLIESEKLASLGQLVAGVAHELGTPIGNALMAVSTLQDRLRQLREQIEAGLRRSDLDRFVQQVDEGSDIGVRNLQRASTLLHGFKQIAVDQTSEQRRRFDLAGLIDEIVLTMRPTLRRHPVRLTVQAEPGIEMDSYPGALAQVLTNLVQNALLHGLEGRPDGELRLTCRPDTRQPDQVVVEVVDNGRGVAADALRRIFEPFYTTRLGRGGSGLGLPIVRSIVTGTLGGQVECISEPGQGTRFVVSVPRVAPRHRPAAV